MCIAIISAGCTDSTTPSGLELSVRGNTGTHQVSENVWFVGCKSVKICDDQLSKFASNHTIVSMSSLDFESYGYTTGYYVITR